MHPYLFFVHVEEPKIHRYIQSLQQNARLDSAKRNLVFSAFRESPFERPGLSAASTQMSVESCISDFFYQQKSSHSQDTIGENVETLASLCYSMMALFRAWNNAGGVCIFLIPSFLAGLTWNGFPSSLRQMIVGWGLPDAWHTNVASSPSLTVVSELVFSNWISGGTRSIGDHFRNSLQVLYRGCK